MSSYEELVQLPMSAAAMRSGKPCAVSATSAASLDSGLARSGVHLL